MRGFWEFSLSTYARPGVADACLSLQDRHGLDVNVLLLCCWLGASGRGRLRSAEVRQAIGVIRPWQADVTAPLRALRRRLKAMASGTEAEAVSAFRGRIEALELEAERIEQSILSRQVSRRAPRHRAAAGRLADAAANLAVYLAEAAVPLRDEQRAALTAILAGAFPGLGENEIEAACSCVASQ